MCWTKAILCSLFAALAAGDDTFFLKPAAGKSGEEIAVVIIQGASCPPGGYQPLGEAIQAASPFPVWIGVPEYIQDIPEPAQFGSKLDDVLGRMATAGMTTNRTIIAAHSLGGVMSQIYLTSLGGHAEALVLMGATVLRSNRDYDFPFPILTIDGELDGLLHVTRQAEAYYHQVSKAGGPSAAVSNPTGQPVVLLDGLNHWSFSSGTPPSNVASHDLKAEVTEEQGHAVAATAISNWVTMRLAPAGAAAHTAAAAALTAAVTKTGEFLGPITQALVMEGYHYLNGPCESDHPTNPTCQYPKWPDHCLGPCAGPPDPLPPTNCECGSPWVMQNAQRVMADLPASVTIDTKDSFHDVSDVRPFHLPHIFRPAPGSACASLDGCTIDTTTVSMPIYDSRDALDTGLYPVTASEFRTKLKSRQAMQESAGMTGVNYTATDESNTKTCASINQMAWDWALRTASNATRFRFKLIGQPLVMVDDVWAGIGVTGPTWIGKAMSYTPSADKKTVEVSAPYFSTENKNLGDESFTDTVGYHYCKLLSPAKAMEWIYADGLQQFGHI